MPNDGYLIVDGVRYKLRPYCRGLEDAMKLRPPNVPSHDYQAGYFRGLMDALAARKLREKNKENEGR